MTQDKRSPVYSVGESVQIRLGRSWRDAWVEELIDPDWLRVRLRSGDQRTVTLAGYSPELRKHGENVLAKEKPATRDKKPHKRKRWSDALLPDV